MLQVDKRGLPVPSQSTSSFGSSTGGMLRGLLMRRQSSQVSTGTMHQISPSVESDAGSDSVLAAAVPIFSYLTGIAASLFAAWFTYGVAGFFWLHDAYHLGDGKAELKRRPIATTLAVLTVLAGTFICVAGTYVSIKVNSAPHCPVRS